MLIPWQQVLTITLFGSLNWQKLEVKKRTKIFAKLCAHTWNILCGCLNGRAHEGGLTPFGLVPRPGNVNAGQPLGTTENCGLLATAGHKCQRFSPLDTRLAFPALQKWCCGVSNQRRVIKICTNKPGKLHADAEPKFVYFACFSIKPKNNNNSNRRGSAITRKTFA